MPNMIGKTLRVFDWKAWARTGDVGNNSQFYRLATVQSHYVDEETGCEIVDVIFKTNPACLSCGHFLSMTIGIN
jgi:hypothetical protein